MTKKSLSAQRKIKKVYLVYKRSIYQKFFIEEKNVKIQQLLKDKHFSVESLIDIHHVHDRSVQLIQKELQRLKIDTQTESRHDLSHFNEIDLIITVGGDGTFLRTAHYVDDELILPINSDPKQSVGALCTISAKHFRKKMHELLLGRSHIKKIPLMQIRRNGKKIASEAVNDVLFTNTSPAATSRYYLQHGDVIEEHKSSGVWIATATGSTAAISAAGGRPMPPDDTRLQFATREPYQGTFNPYRLIHGYVEKGDKLTIVNKMIQAKIFIDGPTNSFDLDFGDKIEFSLSKRQLNVVG